MTADHRRKNLSFRPRRSLRMGMGALIFRSCPGARSVGLGERNITHMEAFVPLENRDDESPSAKQCSQAHAPWSMPRRHRHVE